MTTHLRKSFPTEMEQFSESRKEQPFINLLLAGTIIAAYGSEIKGGKFDVEDHCFAPLPEQNNLNIDQSLRNNEDRLVVVIFNADGVKESMQISFDSFVILYFKVSTPLSDTHIHIHIYIYKCMYIYIYSIYSIYSIQYIYINDIYYIYIYINGTFQSEDATVEVVVGVGEVRLSSSYCIT